MDSIPINFSYCVSVDGSKHSDYAIELVLTAFFKKGDKLNVVHIMNTDSNRINPYDYEVHKVLDHYINTNGKSIAKRDYHTFCLPRAKDTKHSLQQTMMNALEQHSNILFVGFKGTKTSQITDSNFPKDHRNLTMSNKFIPNIARNKELTKGILYILELPVLPLPTVIVKEVSRRENKETKGFTWCFCIKDFNSSWVQFKNSLVFLNLEVDSIKGVHVKTESGRYDPKLEEKFIEVCKQKGVKHFSFTYLDRTPNKGYSIGVELSNVINFGEEYVDFVVCHYNNHSYYYIENHPLYDIIMNVECNVVFSQEVCHNPVKTNYSDEENPDLDFSLIAHTLRELGLDEDYAGEDEIKTIFKDLKVDNETIKRKDLKLYVEKMRSGDKTYVNKSIQDDDLKITINPFNTQNTILDTEEDFLKKVEVVDLVKDLLKTDAPNMNKLKVLEDYAKMWKTNEPNLRKIIIAIKSNPVSAKDMDIVHKEITNVLTDKKLFTENFKDCLIRYIKHIWKKNTHIEGKAYEDLYQELYDLLPLSDLNSAKNVKQLKKLFEGSHKEIIRDLLDTPGLTLTKQTIEDMHKRILNDISVDNYPFFERLKKSLCHYKKGGDDKDANSIMKQWWNLELLLKIDDLMRLKGVDEIKEFFMGLRDLTKTNLLNIKDLNMTEVDINELHDAILKGLVPNSPYIEELVQLVNIYMDSVVNKHVNDILLCKEELYRIVSSQETIMRQKKQIGFTSKQTKEELFKAWKEDERHLIYISNDIDGLTREELKNFHNEIYYTFAGDITSFFEMKKQLSSYEKTLEGKDFKEIKSSMESFSKFMKKENAPEEFKAQKSMLTNAEAPNFLSYKDKKKFLEAWTSFLSYPMNVKTISSPECPLNSFKMDFLSESIKAALKIRDLDFDWYKVLVQNLANNLYKKEFKSMLDNYNAVNRYKPPKKEI